MKNQFRIPVFKGKSEELEFWSKINLGDYFEPKDFTRMSFPNLKPTSSSISIRLPGYILNRLKEKANEINIPYQSLIKGFIKKCLFEHKT